MDALALAKDFPASFKSRWVLKPYAILHSRFREIMLLDADNVPVQDPASLFSTTQYRETGALFWPDFRRFDQDHPIWRACGVPYRDEPEFESGQIVVDKRRCWRALNLAMWYNEHADFFYRIIHGDKDTFHLAFRKLDVPYAMPSRPIHRLPKTMCQHDFSGERMFQHRNLAKWSLYGENVRIPGFRFEDDCLQHLSRLRKMLDPHSSKMKYAAAAV